MSKNENLLSMTAATIHDVRGVVSSLKGTEEELETELKEMQKTILNMIRTCPSFSFYHSLLAFSQHLTTYSESLDQLQSGVNRLKGITNNYLDLSKMSAGKFELHPVLFEIKAPIEELLKQKHSDFKTNGIKLDFEHPPEKIQVIADQSILYRVLLNLLSNALQYTPQGGSVKIRIEKIPAKDESKVEFLFSISDSGEGMDAKQKSLLFHPFSQTKQEHSSKGTGLGLVTSKEFVEMLGGKISVESELGKGSTFSFNIICQPGLPPSITKKPQASKPKITLPSNNVGIQVLIVEDNVINQRVLKSKVEAGKYTVFVANDGKEALNILKQNPYIDVVFMDMEMPVMGGLEATKQWREYEKQEKEKGNNLPRKSIIALSGNTDNESKQKTVEAGMDGYLVKGHEQNILKIIKKFQKSEKEIKLPVIERAPISTKKEELSSSPPKTARKGFTPKSMSEESFQGPASSTLQPDFNQQADVILQNLHMILFEIPCKDEKSKQERTILLTTLRDYDKLVGQGRINQSHFEQIKQLEERLYTLKSSALSPQETTFRKPNLFSSSSSSSSPSVSSPLFNF